MSKRLISVLVFALVVSTGATLLVYKLFSSRMSAEVKPSTTQVMVAARNMPVGTMIGETDLKAGAWSGSLPAGAVLQKDDAIGRGVVAAIYEGEPISEARLAAKGAGAGLAATIPPGMRAVAIRVNDVVGVAGFVVPGQRVDILVLGMPPGGSANTGTITKTILQNITVLSAGQDIKKDTEGKPATVQVVNLLVTPEQAEVLSLISNDMRIQLILRNPLDTVETKTAGMAASGIFTGAQYKPAEAPRARVVQAAYTPPPAKAVPAPVAIPITVEVIQGTKRETAKFKDESSQSVAPEVRQ
jgi:pilus assembly protein CpaB